MKKFQTYLDFEKLITPAKIEYYFVKETLKDSEGLIEETFEYCYIDTFNDCKSEIEFESKLKGALNKLEADLAKELFKLNSKTKRELFKLNLKYKLEDLRKLIKENGEGYIHLRVIPKQIDKNYYKSEAEIGFFFYPLEEAIPYFKLCNRYISYADLIVTNHNIAEGEITEKIKANNGKFYLVRKGFTSSKLDKLYHLLVDLKYIIEDKNTFNYHFPVNYNRTENKHQGKIKWIGSEALLIYLIRDIIPGNLNKNKWKTADSVFELSKNPKFQISKLVNRSDKGGVHIKQGFADFTVSNTTD